MFTLLFYVPYGFLIVMDCKNLSYSCGLEGNIFVMSPQAKIEFTADLFDNLLSLTGILATLVIGVVFADAKDGSNENSNSLLSTSRDWISMAAFGAGVIVSAYSLHVVVLAVKINILSFEIVISVLILFGAAVASLACRWSGLGLHRAKRWTKREISNLERSKILIEEGVQRIGTDVPGVKWFIAASLMYAVICYYASIQSQTYSEPLRINFDAFYFTLAVWTVLVALMLYWMPNWDLSTKKLNNLARLTIGLSLGCWACAKSYTVWSFEGMSIWGELVRGGILLTLFVSIPWFFASCSIQLSRRIHFFWEKRRQKNIIFWHEYKDLLN